MLCTGGSHTTALGCTVSSHLVSRAPHQPARAPTTTLQPTGSFTPTHICSPTGKLDITPDDPRWIGAWWGGFLLCGALLFFSSLPMFGFPQSLPPRPERTGESEQAMLPDRDYERPKPSNGVLRHPLDGDSSSTTCFQQLRGEA